MVNQHFWRGKKVLITGHTGFKGSWLSLWLQTMGAQVAGYALEPIATPNLFTLARVADGMHSVIGDINNFNQLQDFFYQQQPEIVIHLAAQAVVSQGYQQPVLTYTTNVLGTVHLLEAVRHTASVKVVLNVTSDKCYEHNATQTKFTENDRLGGADPYSNSKACAELVTSAYRGSYFAGEKIAIATARAGNVIGGGDWAADRLIPDIMNAYYQKRALKLRYPDAIRPWQFVLEPLHGYLMLAEKLFEQPSQFAEAWNFGPQEHNSKSVQWIVNYISKKLVSQDIPMEKMVVALKEMQYLGLDSSKANTRLHWQPGLTLEQALQETVRWYQAFQEGVDMQKFTVTQLQSYTDGLQLLKKCGVE
jgi:CDP-glucose 4,6-dehydratase